MSVNVIVKQHMHGRPHGGLASQKSRHASAVSGRVLLPWARTFSKLRLCGMPAQSAAYLLDVESRHVVC